MEWEVVVVQQDWCLPEQLLGCHPRMHTGNWDRLGCVDISGVLWR